MSHFPPVTFSYVSVLFLPATAVTSPLIIDQFICVQVLYPAAGGSDDWAYGGAGGVPCQDSYRVFI